MADKKAKQEILFADDTLNAADDNKANVPDLTPNPEIPVVKADETAASKNAPPTGGIIGDGSQQKAVENAEAVEPAVKSGQVRLSDAETSRR